MTVEGKEYTFYRKTSFGVSTWAIWFSGATIFYAHCNQEGGAKQTNLEEVILNQSGRSLQQQIELQMASRLSRMLDKGYKPSREEALQGSTNQMGLQNPMKAHPIQKVTLPVFDKAYVQRKYNGHRCCITRQDGVIVAYTNRGKPITTIRHITGLLEDRLPEGATLDGELYIHGRSLQAISSYIKRLQPESLNLCYHSYDAMEDTVFSQRLQFIEEVIRPIAGPTLSVAPTFVITALAQAYSLVDSFRAEKYEGGILRLDSNGYEASKRSNQVLKLKSWLDTDYEVVDAKSGKYGVAIFILKLPNGLTFDCLAPGPVTQKQYMLAHKEDFKGRMLTVRYANLTDDGIPFNGTAVQFVEEL